MTVTLAVDPLGVSVTVSSAAVDAVKVPSVENRELTNVLPLKFGVGRNTAMHASPTAGNFFHVLIRPSRSIHFFFSFFLLLLLFFFSFFFFLSFFLF